MTIDDKIRDGNLQYDINRESAKISALSLGKIDKYYRGRYIYFLIKVEQAKFIYYPFIFYLGFLSWIFTIHSTEGEGGGHFFNSSLPIPHASQTSRH